MTPDERNSIKMGFVKFVGLSVALIVLFSFALLAALQFPIQASDWLTNNKDLEHSSPYWNMKRRLAKWYDL